MEVLCMGNPALVEPIAAVLGALQSFFHTNLPYALALRQVP
jgi:hypothetical protein